MNKEFEQAVLYQLKRIADALESYHEDMKASREKREAKNRFTIFWRNYP